jgi:hypothetical protein
MRKVSKKCYHNGNVYLHIHYILHTVDMLLSGVSMKDSLRYVLRTVMVQWRNNLAGHNFHCFTVSCKICEGMYNK